MKIKHSSLIVLSIFFIFSCGTSSQKETISQEEEVDTIAVEKEKKTVSFRYEMQETTYPDAILELYSPLENETFEEGDVPFEFNIKNYPFEHGRKGFQLKMIINGDDPIGYNMPIFRKEFETGTYKILAFLVDDEGFALKEYGNYVERDFVVGNSNPFPDSEDPYIGVNKPENESVYEAGEEVVVDFVLVGGDLEKDGFRAKVTVDGQEFMIHEMGLVKITDLPIGEHKLSVALVGGDGKELPGIFSKSIKHIKVKGS